MAVNPCLPIHHTAATLRAWAIWRHARPGWVAKVVVPACVRAGALALPLALPGAAFLPPLPVGGVVFSGPALTGSAYEIGSVFVPGVYGVALPLPYAGLGAQRAGRLPEEVVGSLPATATGGIPVTPMTSGDVLHFLPGRDVSGQSMPPVEVPEPASWAVIAAALVGCLGFRRWAR